MRSQILVGAAATAGLLLSLLTTMPADAGPVAPPSSIAADCSIDVSAQLADWLKAQPSGSRITMSSRACYKVEREITIRDKSNWVLDGNGALLRRDTYTPVELRYPKANAFLRLINFNDSVIQDLHIKGTNTKPDYSGAPPNMGSYRTEVEFDHGLALHGVQGVVISNLEIESVWGDGVQVIGLDKWTRRRSANVTIKDTTVTQNGRQGMSFNQVTGVLVDRATITYSRRGGIDLEPNGQRDLVNKIEVRNSRISSRLLPFPSKGKGPVNEVFLHHNILGRVGLPLVYAKASPGMPRHDWRVEDNIVERTVASPRAAFEFSNVHGISVARNSIKMAERHPVVAVALFAGSSGAKVTCNRFVSAAAKYVMSDPGTNPIVRDNVRIDGPMPCAREQSASSSRTKPKSKISFNVNEPARSGKVLRVNGKVQRRADDRSWRAPGHVKIMIQYRARGAAKFRTRLVVTATRSGKFSTGRTLIAARSGTWRAVLGETRELKGAVSRRDFVGVKHPRRRSTPRHH